jgi:rhamnose utilization protein RhaD (predicted bifunctional aldolase and dehydrogenase)/NAD(P)-dependent dehydrogenase (short-subunit alcohol dehydrogenase family)
LQEEADQFLSRYGDEWGEDLALRAYSARLLGADSKLVLHGGGNTSVKASASNLLGELVPAIYVKASGHDLASIEPQGHAGLELDYLQRLRELPELNDEAMVREIRSRLFDYRSPNPSIETLVHAFLPAKFIDHTHADAILGLTNQVDGKELIQEAFGDDVVILNYVKPGFNLARATAEAVEAAPNAKAAVWMLHGLVTWGETARDAYERTIQLVTRAEEVLAQRPTPGLQVAVSTELDRARQRWNEVAPVLRGLLAEPSGQLDRPSLPMILKPLINRSILDLVDSDNGKELVLTPPLTSDHLIRTKSYPLWIEAPAWGDPSLLESQLREGVEAYRSEYEAYVGRNSDSGEEGLKMFDSAPRVVMLPGMGVVCSGKDTHEAGICADVTVHTLDIKMQIGSEEAYQGMSENDLFSMEYRGLQHAKLQQDEPPLRRQVAIVTGAAGAIGAGICQGLLEQGCHVAVTDLPGDRLDSLVEQLGDQFGPRVIGVAIDVTDRDSVSRGFNSVISEWGGVDLVIVNAGVALVSSLEEMELEVFRRLERVNVEGTLLMLAEAGRLFRRQGIGGDIVLISTKNVFAPGARFGAYSATKAGSHQLARIASLELAEIGVRVNMVSPDAVFGEDDRKSGLWAEVGPDRMKARGLDEKSMQEYYQTRNLLKSKVTAEHVSNAVLFFVTRQTPTSGATIPVDGGLPDATPR